MICRAVDLPIRISAQVPTGPIPAEAARLLAAMLLAAVDSEQDEPEQQLRKDDGNDRT